MVTARYADLMKRQLVAARYAYLSKRQLVTIRYVHLRKGKWLQQGMQSHLFYEWAVKSHGCDMKSLRHVRGFHVVPVYRATKTIIGYDLNLSD